MILGFTGKARSGKSTAVMHFMKSDQVRVRVNFKDALLAEVKKNFGPLLGEIIGVHKAAFEQEYTVEELFADKPPLVRKLLQCYGTEVRRGDDTDYWIKQWIKAVAGAPYDVLADDVRFLNEAQAVRDMGGVVIRIIREDQVFDAGFHQSEIEMDSIVPDYTVTSKTGDHEGLYRQLDDILAELSTGNHLSLG